MDILIYAGIVMALTQVFKKAFAVSTRFIPLLSLCIGAGLFVVAYITGATTLNYGNISDALVAVLSAMGVYSGVKATSGL